MNLEKAEAQCWKKRGQDKAKTFFEKKKAKDQEQDKTKSLENLGRFDQMI